MPLGFGTGFRSFFAGSGAGPRRIFSPILAHQSRAHLIKQLLDPASVEECPFEHRDHGLGDVEAAAAASLDESEQVVGMLVAASAGRTMGADAGFMDLGKRSFQGGPTTPKLFAQAWRKQGIPLFLLHRLDYSR